MCARPILTISQPPYPTKWFRFMFIGLVRPEWLLIMRVTVLARLKLQGHAVSKSAHQSLQSQVDVKLFSHACMYVSRLGENSLDRNHGHGPPLHCCSSRLHRSQIGGLFAPSSDPFLVESCSTCTHTRTMRTSTPHGNAPLFFAHVHHWCCRCPDISDDTSGWV
jgi:hypothetical protein